MTMCAYMSPEERGKQSKTPEEKGKSAVENIIYNYKRNEESLVQQLYFKVDHGSTIGGFRETIWRGMFEQILPKKFAIEHSVFIIDSCGRVSNEVDLAIFDEMYTPYIFRFGKLKFLPIESVAVVVECKSTHLDREILGAWVSSITALRTSQESCVRIAGRIACGIETEDSVQKKDRNQTHTQTETRPLRILCCLQNEEGKSAKPESFINLFDMVISATEGQGLTILTDSTKSDLRDWYLALNHAHREELPQAEQEKINKGDCISNIKLSVFEVKSEEVPVSLLTLNLQLNQLLMLINNPIWFPHKAYADMFNGHDEKKVESK